MPDDTESRTDTERRFAQFETTALIALQNAAPAGSAPMSVEFPDGTTETYSGEVVEDVAGTVLVDRADRNPLSWS